MKYEKGLIINGNKPTKVERMNDIDKKRVSPFYFRNFRV